MQPSGVHATRRGPFLHQQADVVRMKAVDVLRRIDGVEHTLFRIRTHAVGQRRLHQDAVDPLVGIQPADQRERIGQASRTVEPEELGAAPGVARPSSILLRT